MCVGALDHMLQTYYGLIVIPYYLVMVITPWMALHIWIFTLLMMAYVLYIVS